MKTTDTNYNELKQNYIKFVSQCNNIGDFFGGPSLYFHNRALEARTENFLSDNHLELIYATLSSWGMHRMGVTKTKMHDFDTFKKSILVYKDDLINLKYLNIIDLNATDYEELIIQLKKITFNITVSTSNSKLVGNSKALAHIIPDLVPPIDRQYTILFFQCEPDCLINSNGKLNQPLLNNNNEIEYFDYILRKTFEFVHHIKHDDCIKIQKPFNTSYPKIFDNFIISYIKTIKNGA